jgi:hypothetical protein
MTTSSLTRKERVRRSILLCAHCVRNVAYYRAGHESMKKTHSQFWATVDGNFIDTAFLQWCKLFGDGNGKHHWRKVVTNPSEFERELLQDLGVTSADEFSAFIKEIRVHRDKFIAHLDDLRVANIPFLDLVHASTDFYHAYLVAHEIAASDLAPLPANLMNYYTAAFHEAQTIFRTVH